MELTLVGETVEVGGVRDVKADGEQGALVGKDQVLVGPGMGGHLPKHQLPLRHLQAWLHSKTLQGALELLGTPAPNHCTCWVYTRQTPQKRGYAGLRKAVMLVKLRRTHVSP